VPELPERTLDRRLQVKLLRLALKKSPHGTWVAADLDGDNALLVRRKL
jgi:hypothetical protein